MSASVKEQRPVLVSPPPSPQPREINLQDLTATQPTTKTNLRLTQSLPNTQPITITQTKTPKTGVRVFEKKSMGPQLQETLSTNENQQRVGNDQAIQERLTNVLTPETSNLASEQHTYLDDSLRETIQPFLAQPPSIPQATQTLNRAFLEKIKESFADENGIIDFKKLELNEQIIKNARISGKIFITDNGDIDFEISGKHGEEMQECLKAFQSAINEIKQQNNHFKDINLGIPFQATKPISEEDRAIIQQGGQIYYKNQGKECLKEQELIIHKYPWEACAVLHLTWKTHLL